MSIDIVKPLRRYLASLDDISIYIDQDAKWDLFLFQEKLMTRMESTQKIAVVLKQEGNWTTANTHNTMRFPRLITEFWSDPPRDTGNQVTNPIAAKNRIKDSHEYIDRFLHIPAGGNSVWWPSETDSQRFRVIKCARQGELEFFDVPDGNGLVRATVSYAVITG